MDLDDSISGAIDSADASAPKVVRELRAPPAGARTEVDIIRAVASGEATATRVLMDVHMPTVYGFVYARLGGRSPVGDDIVQETLLEACRSAKSFRGDSSLATWLCAIAKRRIARHFEAERKAEVEGLWVAPPPPDPETHVDHKDKVIRALRPLPPTQRQVLVLKYMDDLTVEQIADHIGRSRIQVQSLLARARDSFKRAMRDDD